jgi:hypothetical protein
MNILTRRWWADLVLAWLKGGLWAPFFVAGRDLIARPAAARLLTLAGFAREGGGGVAVCLGLRA